MVVSKPARDSEGEKCLNFVGLGRPDDLKNGQVPKYIDQGKHGAVGVVGERQIHHRGSWPELSDLKHFKAWSATQTSYVSFSK